jgi:hypothetical protein
MSHSPKFLRRIVACLVKVDCCESALMLIFMVGFE